MDTRVLIGPAGAGKSTIGALLAPAVGTEFVDLDEIAGPYYAEVGWSIERLIERIAATDRVAAEREWEPARAHAVARVIADYPGAVIALGAGHGSYTDPLLRGAVRRSLATAGHVVLILPSLDRTLALEELRVRSLASKGTDWVSGGYDFLAHWFDDEGTRELATSVFATEGMTAEEAALALAELTA